MKKVIEPNLRFGKLVLIERAGVDSRGYLWVCACDCGNKIVKAQEYFFRRNSFCSCGCANIRKIRNFDLNQRFGKLVILKKVGRDKRGSLWLCRCDCGKEVVKAKPYFFRKNNPLRSCGCDQKHRNFFKDLTGEKYGRLTVIKLHGIENYRSYWLCKCDCGEEKVICGASLYGGNSRSCGCYALEIRRKLLPGESGFNRLLRNYVRGTRERGIKFELSVEKFRKIVSGNCNYCGATPANKISDDFSEYSEFVYNGIDRMDNFKGYEENNVVSCCGRCNRMKGVLGKDEFINQCILIYNHFHF